jgi:predicted component of type VI protein secretion system
VKPSSSLVKGLAKKRVERLGETQEEAEAVVRRNLDELLAASAFAQETSDGIERLP